LGMLVVMLIVVMFYDLQ